MVRWILLLISVLLEDGVEGIISDDLSETLESNRLNSVKLVGWGNLEGDGLDLIDWDINWHGVLVEVILSLGLDKVGGSWSSSVRWGLLLSLNERNTLSVLLVMLSLLVVMLMLLVLLENKKR